MRVTLSSRARVGGIGLLVDDPAQRSHFGGPPGPRQPVDLTRVVGRRGGQSIPFGEGVGMALLGVPELTGLLERLPRRCLVRRSRPG